MYFVDAGALLSTWTQKHPTFKFITTPEIVEELRNKPSQQRADNLISTGRLSTESASPSWIKKVKMQARHFGDIQTLSENDIELIVTRI